jgi:hypothetical protein
MDKTLKEFFWIQRCWIRLIRPSGPVLSNRNHPLHLIEVDLSHLEPIVRNLIDDVLTKENIFTKTDVLKLLQSFKDIEFQLSKFQQDDVVKEYQSYVSTSLSLLKKAQQSLQD